MKCPECQFENPEGMKFCGACGTNLERICSKCKFSNPPQFKFCGECGQELEEVAVEEEKVSEAEGERKHVTVLFSDLSGYTAMSEKLDPEEVKEITSRIFGEISKVIDKYEGFVEKFVGDAVMALFGVPKAHEDAPLRAIRAAREIHELVDALSPEIEKRVGQPISMHTGINTGLVVTGEVDIEKGTHGVAGGTINLASRLSSLAKVGEILVGPDTYRQAEGHFAFQPLEPTMIKGKTEPVQAHKVLSPKGRPVTMHRFSGLRADLIGRKVELAQLEEAVENLRSGKGSIFSICGDAGTGKSRLIDEFKTTLELEEIQWLEGHAYAYAQNIPYFPLIDLLNRVFEIEEGDPPEKVRERVESGMEDLIGKKEDVVAYVGSLYALNYPALEDVSPEFWKSRLQDAIQTILSALARRAPSVFCLEDLHWADPSFAELLRKTLLEVRQPAIVLCAYRPEFSLFTSHQLSGIAKIYQEIRLHDLSPSEAQDMLESLLKTDTIPSELRRLVQDKAEGNPFYLEEVGNALIESETLVRDDGGWRITRPITHSEISSTIHGVISSRIDRLERETKRILQEASVIGRAFLYKILKRITEIEDRVDRGLSTLERLDLIRTRSIEPDLEYMFKHPLTQEVVYNGLLKKDRQSIHEQIAIVMEQLFQDRLPEFYETLAFHFKQGQSVSKAVDYLIKSAEKCLGRYALEESHLYFKQAFDILSEQPSETKEKEELIIDILLGWASVYHHIGDFSGLIDLFRPHEEMAEHLNDKEKQGMFYAWLGHALQNRQKLNDGYKYLLKALKLGEDIENLKLVGHSCGMLSITCSELGFLDEALSFGKRSKEICGVFAADRELVRHSFVGLGMTHYCRGESRKAYDLGKELLDYGQSHYDLPSDSMGHQLIGVSHLVAGDFPKAIESFRTAIALSEAPYFSQFYRLFLGMSYVSCGQIEAAENTLEDVMRTDFNFGDEIIGTAADLLLGIISIAKGELSRGVRIVEDQISLFFENGSRYRYAVAKYMLGKVYLQIIQRAGPMSFSTVTRNIGFLMKNVPVAGKKGEHHFNKAIEVAKEIGAKGILSQAYLDLGLLHKAKGRIDQARECISEAIRVFEQCEAEVYLKQAKEALASLE